MRMSITVVPVLLAMTLSACDRQATAPPVPAPTGMRPATAPAVAAADAPAVSPAATAVLALSGEGLDLVDPANGMLHVLMPFPGAHPHFARLIFVNQAGQVQKEEIAGMDLELPGVTGSNGFDSDVHSEVFDFGSSLLGVRTVPRGLLDPSPPPNPPVRTRMRITAGKTGIPRRRGGWWNFNLATPVSGRLPTALDWLIDDVNLTRFLDLLGEFRQEAQLLVVTHQKRTMEAADCLYGVTMQPGGSSRVVSERVTSRT